MTVAAGSSAEALLSASLRENSELRRALADLESDRERELQERARAQEALAAAKWLLEAKNEALKGLDRLKDAFVANVAHELRTPLTSITGFTEFLRSSQLDEDAGTVRACDPANAERLLQRASSGASFSPIRTAEQKFKTVFDAAGIGISVGADGMLTETNGAYQRLLGYSADELSRTSAIRTRSTVTATSSRSSWRGENGRPRSSAATSVVTGRPSGSA